MRNSLIFLLCFSACSDDASLGDARIELGTGTVDFVPIADGDELEVIAGPQGGYHFVVHARAWGIVPGDPRSPGIPVNPSTTFAAYQGEVPIDLGLPPYRLGYQDDGDGGLVLPSARILQLQQEVVPDVYGTEVRITVTVRDDDGDSATDERVIRAIEGPPATATRL